MLSSPGQKSAVKPRRHDAEVVELAVSTGDLRSFPDSNNKIEQTGKRDAVCKSERCWVKGWGRTESFLAVWWGNGLILLSHTVTFNLCGILNNTAVECILSLPLWQMSICTAGWLLNGSLWEELTLSWLWHFLTLAMSECNDKENWICNCKFELCSLHFTGSSQFWHLPLIIFQFFKY